MWVYGALVYSGGVVIILHMDEYDFKIIEAKWQKRWEEEKLFAPREETPGRKMYVLDMFPYPSGDGLHVGHVKIYTASDVVSRYLRMKGMNVLHPTGWDAFGLPTENTAIKKKIHPAVLTKQNIERFKKQMQAVGYSYDWEREINTSDPDYYRWTQWIFTKLFDMGLAYEATIPINWCPSCKTGLANEEVEDGVCERCKTAVIKKPIRQWMLKITKYADRLLQGIDGLDWPEAILEMQRNWVGRSEGAEVDFRVEGSDETIKVFTTRLDTIHGATYLVVAPEHELVIKLLSDQGQGIVLANKEEAQAYVTQVKDRSDRDRVAEGKKKSGVELKGVTVINPVNHQPMPVWIADYVLGGYGTGAVMAVPAHDERDFLFANEYKLPIVQVIQPKLAQSGAQLPYTSEGILINAGDQSGLKSEAAREVLVKVLQLKGLGRKKVNYFLRDWVFSRQRYWGEPIPIIHCEECGAVAVPEDELPVKLPELKEFEPTGTGESPLAAAEDWIKVKCPNCPRIGRRETNTMPQWAGSSWYWLRYLDPKNQAALANRDEMDKWLPVDLYVGGAEHAVLHLLYARFWNMVLFDQGVVAHEEPFTRFRTVGLLLGEDGQKMSKSRGNVINPDTVISRVGADALRVYVMFMGPFSNAMPWSEASLNGVNRFLRRVWQRVNTLLDKLTEEDTGEMNYVLHDTIRRVSEGIEQFKFNTAVAALMEMLNKLETIQTVPRIVLEDFVVMLAPLAPHLAEELWEKLGHPESLTYRAWPKLNQAVLADAKKRMAVQVNGKVRGEIDAMPGMAQSKAEEMARLDKNVSKHLGAGVVKKVIYIEGRMLNFVVENKA